MLLQDADRLPDGGRHPTVVPDGEPDAGLLDDGENPLHLVERVGERLLDVDVLPGAGEEFDQRQADGLRGREDHRPDLRIGGDL